MHEFKKLFIALLRVSFFDAIHIFQLPASITTCINLSAASDFWHIGASEHYETLILAWFSCVATISSLRVCMAIPVLNKFSTSIPGPSS